MKKLLLTLCLLLFGAASFAETIYIESNVNMDNFWDKNGKEEQKVLSIGHSILNSNKINKRVPIVLSKTPKSINADSNLFDKQVTISNGILPYLDNDDELAYVVSHEIAHSVESYGGILKYTAMKWNSKKYELDADLVAVDYMVKSGYNPIAGIIVGTKIFAEPMWDWGFTSMHPKGSKRVMEMYKYIYKKYPQYLNSSMITNVNYINFQTSMSKEIKGFEQKQKNRNKSIDEAI